MNVLLGKSGLAGAPKKILILYSSSGGGHLAAAKNIRQALELAGSNLRIEIKDSYDFVHPFKKWQYTRGWQLVTTFMSGPYRYLRNRVVHSSRAVAGLKRGFGKAAAKLARYLTDNPADAVIATHAHAAGIAGIVKDTAFHHFYLAQVYTDYQFHAFYRTDNVDRYFAPAEWVALQLKKDNPRAIVSAGGAPINVCFGLTEDRQDLKKKFGIKSDGRLVVLISRGSFGWGNKKNLRIIRRLLESDLPVHIIAHAGKNKKLAEQMFKLGSERRYLAADFRVLGWVNNMFELMRITDVYVGKPGGMQVAEALAAGTPLLMFDPMPGQEDANVDFVVAQKVGALIKQPEHIVERLWELIKDPALLREYKKRARDLGSSRGALVVARQILKDLSWPIKKGEPDLSRCVPGTPSTK